MTTHDPIEPTVFVILGGSGDLTWRRFVPALFDLSHETSLPVVFSIFVVARITWGEDPQRRFFHDGVRKFSRHEKAHRRLAVFLETHSLPAG